VQQRCSPLQVQEKFTYLLKALFLASLSTLAARQLRSAFTSVQLEPEKASMSASDSDRDPDEDMPVEIDGRLSAIMPR
jgi:hypothetical protein